MFVVHGGVSVASELRTVLERLPALQAPIEDGRRATRENLDEIAQIVKLITDALGLGGSGAPTEQRDAESRHSKNSFAPLFA